MIESTVLVQKTKEKYSSASFKFDYSHLDKKLEEMLILEKKIDITKKTVAKNKLIKRLKAIHGSVDSYVYNYNKFGLFDFISEKFDEEFIPAYEQYTVDILNSLAPVKEGVVYEKANH